MIVRSWDPYPQTPKTLDPKAGIIGILGVLGLGLGLQDWSFGLWARVVGFRTDTLNPPKKAHN